MSLVQPIAVILGVVVVLIRRLRSELRGRVGIEM